MGVYEDMLGRIRTIPDAAPFPELTPPSPIVADPAAAAAADAAAVKEAQLRERRRFALPDKRPNILNPEPSALSPYATGLRDIEAPEDPSLNSQPAAVQLAMNDAPAGTGVPFSTQAGMLAPPVTVGQEPVPLPRARPEADGPSVDIGARSRGAPGGASVAPMQIAPQIAAPDTGMLGGSSILDRIRTGLGDNSNTLLALGAGFAGAPNWGQAISRAASAAIPARAADIKQKLDLQTRSYGTRALVEAGVPIQQAIAAAVDPDLKKALIQNYIVDRKGELKETGTDRYGNKVFQIFDPYTKALTPIKGGGDPSAAVTPENDVTGPDYLAKLKEQDPAYARQVEQVLNGDAAMPTGRQAQTPFGRKLRQDVLTVEPGSSDSDFSTRLTVRKSYDSGNDAKITKSINTTLKHAGTLEKAINGMDNFSTMPLLNYPRAAIEGQASEEYRKARAAYDTAVANFAKELDFTVSGGRPTVSGTRHQMEGFNALAAKDAQLEKLRTGVELLKGRLDSHSAGYAKGLKKAVEPIDFVDPANRQIYKRLVGDETEPTGIPVPGVGGAPKPGKYVYDPANNSLVPAQ
jgi:hypothetical protein